MRTRTKEKDERTKNNVGTNRRRRGEEKRKEKKRMMMIFPNRPTTNP